MLKFYFSIVVGLLLVVVIVPLAFAVPMYSNPTTQFDLDFIDLEVLDVQLLFMDDIPGYYKDNVDLIKVTVNVTNNAYDIFAVHDKMFRIWVIEVDLRRSTPDNEVVQTFDVYKTTYKIHLNEKYDDLQSRKLFEECDYVNKAIHLNQSKSFTVCYEVLRNFPNESLSFEENKKYFLLMNDNTKGTSCPDCKKILLTPAKPIPAEFMMPPWVENLFSWHAKGLISEEDFQNSLDFLQKQGIVTQIPESKPVEITLEEKNLILKEFQTKLAAAQTTNLYVSASTFYEPKHFDDFSGVVCRQQNNIVTFSGDYSNEDEYFDAILFKLSLYDDYGDVVETGLSKISDVSTKELRHFEVSAPYYEKFNHCLIIIDSKFN